MFPCNVKVHFSLSDFKSSSLFLFLFFFKPPAAWLWCAYMCVSLYVSCFAFIDILGFVYCLNFEPFPSNICFSLFCLHSYHLHFCIFDFVPQISEAVFSFLFSLLQSEYSSFPLSSTSVNLYLPSQICFWLPLVNFSLVRYFHFPLLYNLSLLRFCFHWNIDIIPFYNSLNTVSFTFLNIFTIAALKLFAAKSVWHSER